ncbi:Trafficking protein particle complex subunit 13 [Erysiphe neolycopersici]|uniref:Trafficking protein particle complex subunit 13 n=1 Tax=Erysiphe neolycopersici TaxID=212602 RepID=A0A420I0E7_9PEZI|nr:Trafficking protein particle complex subunit 13 [Erysiphe neolycopersici]
MAQARSPAALDLTREPHSVSLKVLRLSRPSLSIQQPLPADSSDLILTSASYAYPVQNACNDSFILSSLLTLPPAFGYAYVGETFSCTLCANNEIIPGDMSGKTISAVHIEAEIKTPNSGVPIKLSLHPSSSPKPESTEGVRDEKIEGSNLAPGQSLQKLIQVDLKNEGNHVLAVSVTYSEVTATSGRVRSFRKLYQFVCKNCLAVRSKITTIPSPTARKTWALEAQLENCGEENIILEKVVFNDQKGFKSRNLNLNITNHGEAVEKPKLMPGDVQQVCFLVEEEDEKPEIISGKLFFGTISVYWRGTMGNKGCLSTDLLGIKFN